MHTAGRLLTTGIGEDYIYLNECMAEGKTLLDFPTLYDFDYADYLFMRWMRSNLQAMKLSASSYLMNMSMEETTASRKKAGLFGM